MRRYETYTRSAKFLLHVWIPFMGDEGTLPLNYEYLLVAECTQVHAKERTTPRPRVFVPTVLPLQFQSE